MYATISDKLLISLGFKKTRVWRENDKNFTLKYSIEGFDGQIDLYAQFCAPSTFSPEEQVENHSDIKYLTKYCQSPYHIYGGDFHIVSIDLEAELLLLLSVLKIEPVITQSSE